MRPLPRTPRPDAFLLCVCAVCLWALGGCEANDTAARDDARANTSADTQSADTEGDATTDPDAPTSEDSQSADADPTSADTDPDTNADTDADAPPLGDTIQVLFDPAGQGFWRTPWPSDARLTPAGTPDLSDFPEVRSQPLLAAYRDELQANVRGFATMPVVYVPLNRPLSAASMPPILDTLRADSPLQLIDLSDTGCGARTPLAVQFNTDADRFLAANTVQAAPAIGHVLKPNTPYALVVLQTFGAGDGLSTERLPAFDAAMSASPPATPDASALAPLRRCLPNTDLSPDALAFATVFTTQDPVAETRLLRDAIMHPAVEVRPLKGWRLSEDWSETDTLTTFEATFEAPIYQAGQTPYDNEGGGLVFDAQGQPLIQRWEDVPMSVAWHPSADTTTPRPVLVFIDGTGWSPWGHLSDNWIEDALAEGYVVASFMPQFHGGRAGFNGSTEISTFNFFNPPAGRTNFRQQAAETAYFARVLRDQVASQPDLPPLDLSHLVYGGHSQGALVGALTAAVDDQYSAYVLNGLSAYLSLTIIDRKDIADYEAIIRSTFRIGRPLDRFYPLLQVVQLGAEVVDTHNYVTAWKGWPSHPNGNHVFVINGLLDDTTTPRGIDHLTMTADLAPIAPPGWDVDPDQTWPRLPESLPIHGNRLSLSNTPLTLATLLDADTGHFTIYQRPQARSLALSFWRSSRPTNGQPAVPTLPR